jgi:hypothetical protein
LIHPFVAGELCIKEETIVEIRKIITTREVVVSELGVAVPQPVVRAVGMAVIRNPLVDDLRHCSKQEQRSVSG